MRRTASEVLRSLEMRVARLEKQAANFKFNTMYYSSELIAYFYPLSKLKNGKIQGAQMDIRRGKVRLMSHLDSDFRLLGMEEETDISPRDEKKILDYVNNIRTASFGGASADVKNISKALGQRPKVSQNDYNWSLSTRGGDLISLYYSSSWESLVPERVGFVEISYPKMSNRVFMGTRLDSNGIGYVEISSLRNWIS